MNHVHLYNEVVYKLLETYGNMSTKSKSAGASVTSYPSTVVRGEEEIGQPIPLPPQIESQLYSLRSPLGVTGHGGRSKV